MRYRAAIIAIPAFLAGCATIGTTYSEVYGERYHLAIADRAAVNIVTVGDRGGYANNRAMIVDPGTYRVVVESRAHAGFRGGRAEAFELKVEPCKRYYVNAQFASQVSPDYKPVVDQVETIAGCGARG